MICYGIWRNWMYEKFGVMNLKGFWGICCMWWWVLLLFLDWKLTCILLPNYFSFSRLKKKIDLLGWFNAGKRFFFLIAWFLRFNFVKLLDFHLISGLLSFNFWKCWERWWSKMMTKNLVVRVYCSLLDTMVNVNFLVVRNNNPFPC